ncbi:hypothetical protein BS17DRAFT_553666 [Gyrodon lividus]|nr:hypothetical protein BS17DRAFT_553666 [Gyrodon lividus]
MSLPPLPFGIDPSSIAASMGCPEPTTSDSGPPPSSSPSPSSLSPLVPPSSLPPPKTTSLSSTAMQITTHTSALWPSTPMLSKSSPSKPSSAVSSSRSSTPSATSAARTPTAHTSSGTAKLTLSPAATPGESKGQALRTPPIIIPPTAFTSLSSRATLSRPTTPATLTTVIHEISTPTPSSTILSSVPILGPTTSPISQSTIMEASIGGTVGTVALLAVLITIYLRYRFRKPVVTPYSYSYATVPASPRHPSHSAQPEIRFGSDAHMPEASIPSGASAQSQNRRASLTVTLSDAVRDDNTTLCVPEDKSIAARRQRARELEKLYPVRPWRSSGEYGVGSASTSTESLSVCSRGVSPV